MYTLDHILNDIDYHLKNKKPFSIVRPGDGDLKLLLCLFKRGNPEVKFGRNGIPINEKNIKQVLRIYRMSCNNANYISSFDCYFQNNFWSRRFSKGTKKKMMDWKRVYKKAGITNINFCNPELGFLLFLNRPKNLLKLIKNKKICLITSNIKAEDILNKKGFNTSSILIPNIYKGHYSQFPSICLRIKRAVKDYDIFLVGAGLLGRWYSYIIKKNGGIAIDIGQVLNVWTNNDKRKMPPRLKRHLKRNDNLTFSFIGKKFSKII